MISKQTKAVNSRRGLTLCWIAGAVGVLAGLTELGAQQSVPENDWIPSEIRILRSMSLAALGEVPPDPSNQVADDPRAADFGQQLFFDARFSANGLLSCASCHQPDQHYTDARPRAVGSRASGRNTPTVVGAGYATWFYWDGRRDSLWSQALIPFEAPAEMGGSRVAVVRLIGADSEYRSQYDAIFGNFPSSLLDADAPEHAGPLGGSAMRAAWKRLPRTIQQGFNQVYANVGKVIAAYERTLVPQATLFDRYVDSLVEFGNATDRELLSRDQVAGLKLFIDPDRTRCLRCHNGPLLSNGGFHNIGTGNFTGAQLDFGRVLGLQAVLLDEFNCLGPYSDAAPEQCSALRFLNRDPHTPLHGAFKTPSLRNLVATAPYFHDGSMPDLESVLQHYNNPPSDPTGTTHELSPMGLNDQELAQLLLFLKSLSTAKDPVSIE